MELELLYLGFWEENTSALPGPPTVSAGRCPLLGSRSQPCSPTPSARWQVPGRWPVAQRACRADQRVTGALVPQVPAAFPSQCLEV